MDPGNDQDSEPIQHPGNSEVKETWQAPLMYPLVGDEEKIIPGGAS
jgi:hypothetical protein